MNLRLNALFVVKMLPREEELVLDSTGTSLYSFNACALVKAKKTTNLQSHLLAEHSSI